MGVDILASLDTAQKADSGDWTDLLKVVDFWGRDVPLHRLMRKIL